MTLDELEALVAVNKDLFDPRWRGVEFGPGWGELLAEMLARCRRESAPPITIKKEKTGALMIYFADQSHPLGREIRSETMERSQRICEICGASGECLIIKPGLRATRCKEHTASASPNS